MRQSCKCPVCSSGMRRLYVKCKGRLSGIAWWCEKCSHKGNALIVYDETILIRRLMRWSRARPQQKADGRFDACRVRAIYVRDERSGWRSVGFLRVGSQPEIIIEDYLLKPSCAASTQNTTNASERSVTFPVTVTAYAFNCACGRTYVFDLMDHKLLVQKPYGFGRGRLRRMHVYSVQVACGICGRNINVKNLIRGKLVIHCKCGAVGFLDTTKLSVKWYQVLHTPMPYFEVKSVTVLAEAAEKFDINAVFNALKNQNVPAKLSSPHQLNVKTAIPKADLNIFSTGKITCTSFSMDGIKRALNYLIKKLVSGGIPLNDQPKIEVKSTTVLGVISPKINVDDAYWTLMQLGIMAKTNKTRSVVMFKDGDLSFKISKNGTILCMGAKSDEEAVIGIRKIIEKLGIKCACERQRIDPPLPVSDAREIAAKLMFSH